jgi:short-subunit dehydrogenase
MKNYVVIGGSSGMGAAITKQLSASANQVYASYYTHEQTNEAHIQYFYLNVMEETLSLDFLPEQIDGLVYCPGSILLKPFLRISPSDFVRDYELQVLGAVKVIQQILPRLKRSSQASVVLFSTVAVQTGFTFHSVVASSKGAIEGLTRSLAAELAHSVRVNCIAPSITDTPLAGNLINTPEKKETNAKRHPLQKIGSPNDLAAMACFLLSDASGWITGQVFPVDGGMSSLKL